MMSRREDGSTVGDPVENRGVGRAVREFLVTTLEKGPRSIKEIRAIAEPIGFSYSQLVRGAKQLGISKDVATDDNNKVFSVWRLASDDVAGREMDDDTSEPAPRREVPAKTQRPRSVDTIAAQLDALRSKDREVEVYRIVDGVASYVTTARTAQISLEWIKRRCGGGRFALGGVEVTIEGQPKPFEEVTATLFGPSTNVPAPVAPTALDTSAQVMRTAMEALSGVTAAMAQLAASRVTADPIDSAVKLAALMRNDPPATPLAEAMQMFKEGMRMGRVSSSRGGDEGWDRIVRIMEPLAQRLGRTLESANARRADTTQGAEGTRVENTLVADIVAQMGPVLPKLNTAARFGHDPEVVAQELLSGLEEEAPDLYAQLDAAAQSPQFAAQVMAALRPKLPNDQKMHTWYLNLIDAVQRGLEPDDDNASANSDGNGVSPVDSGS